MSMDWITVDLRAWHPEGKRVADKSFLERLSLGPDDPVVEIVRGKPEQAARITLLSLEATMQMLSSGHWNFPDAWRAERCGLHR